MPILFALLTLGLFVIVLQWWTRRHPKGRLARLLVSLQIGPKTDVARMSRAELFRSSLHFFAIGILALGLFLLSSLLLNPETVSTSKLILFFGFLLFLITLMGFLGGMYLSVRAIFRRRHSVPPAEPEFRPTGYYINEREQIWGPSGATGIVVDDGDLTRNGVALGVFIDANAFFRRDKTWLGFISVFKFTGHLLDDQKQILGLDKTLPWELEV